jgi:hypothetical protein
MQNKEYIIFEKLNIKLNKFNFCFLFIYSIFLFWFFFWNKKIMIWFFDDLYNYDLLFNFMKNYITYFIWFLIAYITFIWYINLNKWLSIAEDNLNWSYFQVFSIIFLCLESIVSLFILYLFYKWKFLEVTILVICFILKIPIKSFLQTYWELRNNYNFLEYINKNQIKLESIQQYFNNLYKWKWKIEDFFKFHYIELIQFMISCSITMSIFIFPVWFIFKLNLITIFYLHFYFIAMYITFNLFKHKFPYLTEIKSWNKKFIGYLVEDYKNNVIIRTKNEMIKFDRSKVEYIKQKINIK